MHSIYNKARRLLGLISKILIILSTHADIAILIYTKPTLECGLIIWELFKGNENLVEQVQRRATIRPSKVNFMFLVLSTAQN